MARAGWRAAAPGRGGRGLGPGGAAVPLAAGRGAGGLGGDRLPARPADACVASGGGRRGCRRAAGADGVGRARRTLCAVHRLRAEPGGGARACRGPGCRGAACQRRAGRRPAGGPACGPGARGGARTPSRPQPARRTDGVRAAAGLGAAGRDRDGGAGRPLQAGAAAGVRLLGVRGGCLCAAPAARGRAAGAGGRASPGRRFREPARAGEPGAGDGHGAEAAHARRRRGARRKAAQAGGGRPRRGAAAGRRVRDRGAGGAAGPGSAAGQARSGLCRPMRRLPSGLFAEPGARLDLARHSRRPAAPFRPGRDALGRAGRAYPRLSDRQLSGALGQLPRPA